MSVIDSQPSKSAPGRRDGDWVSKSAPSRRDGDTVMMCFPSALHIKPCSVQRAVPRAEKNNIKVAMVA